MNEPEFKEMDLNRPEDAARVHQFLLSHPEASSHQYPGYMSACYPNRSIRFFLLTDGMEDVCGCLVSERAGIADLQFGPIGTHTGHIAACVLRVNHHYHKKRYGMLRVQLPCYPDDSYSEKIAAAIRSERRFYTQKKNNWATLMLSLRQEYNELRRNYSENLRRNIKKGITLGLHVKMLASDSEIKKLGEIFDSLYTWRGVKTTWTNSPETFLRWYQYFDAHCKACWFGVFDKDEKMLGGILLVKQGDTVFYQTGATDPEQRSAPVLHVCFDHAIRWAKDSGFAFFDFGGYHLEATEADQTYHINNFKSMFGGSIQKSYPAMIFPLFKPAYWTLIGLLSVRDKLNQ